MDHKVTTAAAAQSSADVEALRKGQSWAKLVSATLVAVGVVSRLAPFTDPHGRLLRQFMTEDGYLMQTVARNFALGHGLSVSDGTIETNGVQPMATFISAFFHYLAGGDKVGGIAGVMAFSVLVSCGAAYALYLMARRILKGHAQERSLAMLIAALWFAAATIVRHSMNGLETGLYLLVSLVTVNFFARCVQEGTERFSAKQMLALGGLFGLCFLTRNDAAFLIAAILGARFIMLWPRDAKGWRDRIIEALVPGAISVVIGSPWLIFNYRLFGSIMPISGISESLDAKFGANLIQVPAPLFDFMTLVLPIPLSLRTKLLVIIGALFVVVTIFLLAARMLWRSSRSARYVLTVYGLLTVFIVAFYGTYFGAPYFMSRYLAVLSPVLAVFGVFAAYRVLDLVQNNSRRTLLTATVLVAVVLIVGLNVRLYRGGLTTHEHFQVVTWVQNHVPPETWVGAPQTGTLGYFHDRTINLDGKVDPDALRARLRDGDVISYVLASKIVYLADWVGLASWANLPKGDFKDKFKLIVEDKRANLAVLQRLDDQAQPQR